MMDSTKRDSDSDWRDSCPTIRDKHLRVLYSGEFSDVTFLVGEEGEPIHAHKFILILASPVFEVQFGERWNKENVIQIPDVTPKAFQMFLKFLYTEEFSISEKEAEDVLSLAHKYMIKSLASYCSELLGFVIKVSNAINIHRIAANFGNVEESLQKKAMDFILKNGSTMLQDIGFLEIDPNTLTAILKNDNLCADEIAIFRALMRWAERKCQVKILDCTVRNKRIILKDLIHLIRFTRMSTQDFTNEVICGKHEGILSDSESIAIFKHWNAGPSVRSLLPALPFTARKRHGGLLHKLVLQETGTGLGNYASAQHCRYLYGNNTGTACEKTFQFRSSHSICIKAIELRQTIHLNNLRANPTAHLVFNESGFVNPGMYISVSLPPEGNNTLTAAFEPQMSPNIESLNGFRIENDKNYNIKLVIGNIPDVVVPGAALRLSNPVKVVGQEDVDVTFTTISSQCHWERQYSGQYCICHGQIKAIYFTF